jgi:N-acetylglucosamine-6-phosphate deacetylase
MKTTVSDTTVELGRAAGAQAAEAIAEAIAAAGRATIILATGASQFETLAALVADERYAAMIITDGHHLPDEFIRVALRAKGVENTIVVSDAAPVAGLCAGRYRSLGGEVILEENGRLHDPAKGCLAGSSSTMLQCMNYLASLGLLALDDLMLVGRGNALRLMGLADGDVCGEMILDYDEGERMFAVSA